MQRPKQKDSTKYVFFSIAKNKTALNPVSCYWLYCVTSAGILILLLRVSLVYNIIALCPSNVWQYHSHPIDLWLWVYCWMLFECCTIDYVPEF